MDRIKIGNQEAIFSQFTLSDDTDIGSMFDCLWRTLKEQDDMMIIGTFQGIDICRHTFTTLFVSEKQFLKTSFQKQAGYLFAINKSLEKAVESGDLRIANGMSFFILWLVSLIQRKDDVTKEIELQFAALRSHYEV